MVSPLSSECQPLALDLRKCLPGRRENGLASKDLAEPLHSQIDIEGIEFDAAAAPTGALARDQSCPRPQEAVEDDLSQPGDVANSIGNEGNRLDRRVELKIVSA